MISIGDTLPEASFKVMTDDGSRTLSTADVFAGRKVVLFGVPGAFTPGCSNNHLPGYLENHQAMLARGVDSIAVVSVNDQFVMSAWAKFSGGDGKIAFLADGNADFVKLLGLDADFSAGGMGVRSQRFSMLVEDGVVKALNVEPKPGIDVSSAAKMLELL